MKFKSFLFILLLLLPIFSVFTISPAKADPFYTHTFFDFDTLDDGIYSNTTLGYTSFRVQGAGIPNEYNTTLGFGLYDLSDGFSSVTIITRMLNTLSYNSTFYVPWDLVYDGFRGRVTYDYDYGIKIHVPRGIYSWTLYYGNPVENEMYYTLISPTIIDVNGQTLTGIYSDNSPTYGTISGITNTNQIDYLNLDVYGNSTTSCIFALHIEFLYNNPTVSTTSNINTTVTTTTCQTTTVSAETSIYTTTIIDIFTNTTYETVELTGTTTSTTMYATVETTEEEGQYTETYTSIYTERSTYEYFYTTTYEYASITGTITILEVHSITELNPATITETITETTTEPTTETTTETTTEPTTETTSKTISETTCFTTTSISCTTTTDPNTQTTSFSTTTSTTSTITASTTTTVTGGMTMSKVATSISVSIGAASSGVLSQVWTLDNAVWSIAEGNGAYPVLEAYVDFAGVPTLYNLYVGVYGQYYGSAQHVLNLEIYDPEEFIWEPIDRIDSNTVGKQWYNSTYNRDSDNIVDVNGLVKFRFTHITNGISNHYLLVDLFVLEFNILAAETTTTCATTSFTSISTSCSTSSLTIGTQTITSSIITTTLTTYQTTTDKKVDFGSDDSALQSGWVRLGATNGYAASPGYGWVDSGGTPQVMAQVDRGSGSGGALDDLEQDIHYTGLERWFKINVGTAGVYAWTLYYGDSGYAHGPFDIDDNNGHVVDGLSSSASVWSHYHGSTDTGVDTFLYIKIKNPTSNPAFNGIEWSRTFGVGTSVITTSLTTTSSTFFTTTTVTQCSTTTSVYTTCTTTVSTTVESSTYSTTFCTTSVYSSTSSTTTCNTSVFSSTSSTTTCDTSVYSSTSSTTTCSTSVYSSTSSTTFCVTSVYSSTSSTTTCDTSVYSSTSSTTFCVTTTISSISTTETCSSITNLQCSTETTDITCATISGTSTYTDATTTVTNFTETSIIGVIGGGCSWCIPLLMLMLILAVAYIVIRKRG